MSAARPNVSYGGQAVIEGVMIRAPRHMAVAVRGPGGDIVRHAEALRGLATGRARRVPLLRGALVLWETLSLGMRSIDYSTRIAAGETPAFPQTVRRSSAATALIMAAGLFFVGPLLLADLLESAGVPRAGAVVVEAVLRLGLFAGYLALIGLLPDIRRMFQYHGAEHMTIHAWEAGRPLTVASVRGLPKEHPRCGTSLLVAVMIAALLAFLAFDLLVDRGLAVRAASRVVLLLPIIGIAYEALRLGARFGSNAVARALFTPNMAMQGLTTRIPADDQIEVAIAAFETAAAATERDGAPSGGGASRPVP